VIFEIGHHILHVHIYYNDCVTERIMCLHQAVVL